jgi:hypothetical protein
MLDKVSQDCFRKPGKAIFQKWGYKQEELQSKNSLTTNQTMTAHGLKILESRYSVHETIDRLEELLKSKGIISQVSLSKPLSHYLLGRWTYNIRQNGNETFLAIRGRRGERLGA